MMLLVLYYAWFLLFFLFPVEKDVFFLYCIVSYFCSFPVPNSILFPVSGPEFFSVSNFLVQFQSVSRSFSKKCLVRSEEWGVRREEWGVRREEGDECAHPPAGVGGQPRGASCWVWGEWSCQSQHLGHNSQKWQKWVNLRKLLVKFNLSILLFYLVVNWLALCASPCGAGCHKIHQQGCQAWDWHHKLYPENVKGNMILRSLAPILMQTILAPN